MQPRPSQLEKKTRPEADIDCARLEENTEIQKDNFLILVRVSRAICLCKKSDG